LKSGKPKGGRDTRDPRDGRERGVGRAPKKSPSPVLRADKKEAQEMDGGLFSQGERATSAALGFHFLLIACPRCGFVVTTELLCTVLKGRLWCVLLLLLALGEQAARVGWMPWPRSRTCHSTPSGWNQVSLTPSPCSATLTQRLQGSKLSPVLHKSTIVWHSCSATGFLTL